jgi:hypothetical protein
MCEDESMMTYLEWATNQEIIDELTSRENFVGILIYSPIPNTPGTVHREFRQVSRLAKEDANTVIAKIYEGIIRRKQ